MSNINAEELFQKIIDAIDQRPHERSREVSKAILQTLSLACQHALRQSKHNFGNLSSQIDTLAKIHHISAADTIAIQRARHNSLQGETEEAEEAILADLRAVAIFVSAVFNAPIPSAILSSHREVPLPSWGGVRGEALPYIRCIIQKIGEDGIQAIVSSPSLSPLDGGLITINLTDTPEYIDLSYLYDILHEGMQVNLLDCEIKPPSPIKGYGSVHQRESQHPTPVSPHLVVVEPDFLIDISTLAACFEDYGHHHLLYQLRRLAPRSTSQPILMGNLAGRLLDDIIHQPDAPLADSLRTCFRDNALEFCAVADFQPAAFKTEAASQRSNIQACVDELFSKYERDKAMLEPSFVCEQLGIQGRADLITTDMQLLVEQKAGRNLNIERNGNGTYGMHIEKHYVQMLLYYAVLSRNFNVSPRQISMMLLYSKYQLPNGLIEVAPLQKLLREAIKLRNLIVADEYRIAQNGFQSITPLLTPDTMNTQQKSGFFWERYQLPGLEKVTTPLQNAAPLEYAYFCRMATFVLKEQLLSKVGCANSAGGGAVADLWNMPLYEKIETGNIYTGLTLKSRNVECGMLNEITLTLDVPHSTESSLNREDLGGSSSNFRLGDMVYLYGYQSGEEPDVRKSILHRATISELTGDQLTLHLNNPQTLDTFTQHPLFAVEHAPSDINTSTALAGLHRFITADADRRALLLAQRPPRHDDTIQLTRSYHPTYDDILLRAKQALDYFLLIGPPGTGKTSMALRFLVEEELTKPEATLLLMAYTNRAVDEICGMLCNAGIDFLRIGNEFSCDPRFRPYLLANAVEHTLTLAAIKQKIVGTRVIVATTATLMSKSYLFSITHFSLAIVDEASQILEPSIIGLLCLPQIGRFILIGDHKQLPAVVTQSETESAVSEPILQAIGLTDCRHSLFERLLRHLRATSSSHCLGILRRQGRMHPDIAEWPNRMFYPLEQLQPVPLPHQEEPTTSPRVIFIPSHVPIASSESSVLEGSDKTNLREARIVAGELKKLFAKPSPPLGERLRVGEPCSGMDGRGLSIGIIVPYRNQIAMIRHEIEKLGIPELQDISIDTVERYQGSQRDVIIYSFTIRHRYQLDFLTANCFEEDGRIIDRKLNVALTRARKRLILTGNEAILSTNPLFKNLIDYIKEKGGYQLPQVNLS